MTPQERNAAIDRTINSPDIEKALAKYGVDADFIGQLIAVEAEEIARLKGEGKSDSVLEARYRHLIDTLMKFNVHKESSDIQATMADTLIGQGNKAVEDAVKDFLRKH